MEGLQGTVGPQPGQPGGHSLERSSTRAQTRHRHTRTELSTWPSALRTGVGRRQRHGQPSTDRPPWGRRRPFLKDSISLLSPGQIVDRQG